MKKLCNSAKLDSRYRTALHNGYSVGRGADGIRYRAALHNGYNAGRWFGRYQAQNRVTQRVQRWAVVWTVSGIEPRYITGTALGGGLDGIRYRTALHNGYSVGRGLAVSGTEPRYTTGTALDGVWRYQVQSRVTQRVQRWAGVWTVSGTEPRYTTGTALGGCRIRCRADVRFSKF